MTGLAQPLVRVNANLQEQVAKFYFVSRMQGEIRLFFEGCLLHGMQRAALSDQFAVDKCAVPAAQVRECE